MGKNTKDAKELSNEKGHELQEIPEVEESQASQESSSEGSALIENGKEEPFALAPMTKNEKPKIGETETEITVKEIDINKLKPHPQNEKIYGKEDISELVALIEEDGRIKEPLVIKAIDDENFVIISGHRRWLAAKELGFKTVPCEIRKYASLEEELRDILSLNQKREKTNAQRICEGLAWEGVYKKEASERSRANLKQNQSDMDKLSKSEEVELTRNRAAKRVGLSSGKEFDRGKNVMKKIDALKAEGKDEDVELLLAVLNKKISRGEILAKEVDLASLSNEDKCKLKNGKANPRAFVPKTKAGDKSSSRDALFKKQQKKFEDAVNVFSDYLSSSEGSDRGEMRAIIENQIASLEKLLAASSSGETKEKNGDGVET